MILEHSKLDIIKKLKADLMNYLVLELAPRVIRFGASIECA